MRILFIAAIFIAGVFILYPQNTLKIMPLGDSITRGTTVTTDAFGRAGYRKPLIDSLISLGYTSTFTGGNDFDFIGSQVDGNASLNFDRNHEGHRGYHVLNLDSTEISLTHQLKVFLTTFQPNIILLHIGTNDIGFNSVQTVSTLVDEVSNVLDTIYTFNPDISVIIAKIINRADVLTGNTKSDSTSAFNNGLEIMANNRINNGDKLHVVNMETGAGINYVIGPNTPPDPAFDMGDNLHPNNNGYRKMANVWFEKLKELLIPVPVVPMDDSINAPVNITFSWNPAPGANSYHLQVASDLSFSEIVFDDSTLSDSFYTVNILNFNTQYFWRVSGKINTGSSPFSEIRNFTTGDPTSVESEFVVVSNELYQNYPNPFNPSTAIKIAVKTGGVLKVNIYDILGNKIGELFSGTVKDDEVKEIIFNADSDLASGTYFYEFSITNGGEFKQIKKMILLR